jgi:hypothetical protein
MASKEAGMSLSAWAHNAAHASAARNYDKAMRGVRAMRGASVRLGRGGDFNTFLEELAQHCSPESQYSGFWRRVVAEGITLISKEEDAGVSVDADAAVAFLKENNGEQQEVRCHILIPKGLSRPPGTFIQVRACVRHAGQSRRTKQGGGGA